MMIMRAEAEKLVATDVRRADRAADAADLQALVERHGGYDQITPEAWGAFDRAVADLRREGGALPYTLHPQGEGSTSIYYLVQRGGASPMATSLLDCIRSPRVREMIVRELAVFARTGLACSDGWMGS
jgi:hypothetical protein